MTRRTPLAATAALGVAAAVLGTSAPAIAAPAAAHKARPFHVQGIVVSRHGSTVRVLARTATVAGAVKHNKVVTLKLAKSSTLKQSGHRVSAATVTQGAAIDAFGVPAGTTLVVGTANVAPQPTEAVLGIVQALNGSIAQISVTHDKGRGDDELAHHLVTVDLSNATVNGDPVQTGEAVVVLGEDEGNRVFAAAQVFTFTVVPTVVPGKVTAVDDTARTLTLSTREHSEPGDDTGDDSSTRQTAHHDGPGGDDSGSGNSGSGGGGSDDPAGDDHSAPPATGQDDTVVTTTVDTSNAELLLNGKAVDTVPSGTRVLAVGATDSSTGVLHAVLVFAFNGDDHGPCHR
ncbi:MAG TPA: hypothetical protein VHE83_04880 [Mycobacteriales bacterium]|nr:hypothetical protein [Mycobacteriales bacterium]